MEKTERKKVVYNFQRDIEIDNLSVCHNCKQDGLTEEDKFCTKCGFPQRGSQEEMRAFLFQQTKNKGLLTDRKESIKKGKTILFILSGLFLLRGLIMYFLNSDIAELIVGILFAAIYITLGFWSNKKPLPAILIGFFLYIFLIVISAIFEPMSIISGIIWKVIIVSTFIYAIKGIKDASKLENDINDSH